MRTKFIKVLGQDNQCLNNLNIDGKDIIRGLNQVPKTLPSKYFYDDIGSEIFQKICELPEYYPTRTETSILRQCADEVAQITGACELVELGSGSSTKTQFLLNAYQKISDKCKYIPIDVSGGIIKTSILNLQKKYPDLLIEGLIGSYEQALAILESVIVPSRMIFFLGSSIGNFTAQECNSFLRRIAHTLKPSDYFLIGIDLQKDIKILEAAYNDSKSITAAFNLNILSHLNWRFQSNFNLNLFRHEAIYNQANNQIEMYLHCLETHRVSLDTLNLNVFFEAGESILTEISRKFDLTILQNELELQGLKTLKIWTDKNRWYGVILCQAVELK
ncbi:hypothetical protein NIES4071_09450 [Calothrix sp. NIES-4071]|nr:hypothetical protein NIES4071_09450 [Calothrix sp. NIES-4071]BAZ55287.1 hypothetical protein NIES4105_09410 [Calothrix sp. NIES-4105]